MYHHNSHRLLSAALIAALLITLFASCSRQTVLKPGEPSGLAEQEPLNLTLNLGCSADYTAPSPYESKSDIDKALIPLMYEPLYTLDDDFRAVPVLATDVFEADADGELAVTVDTDRQFADGTYITAVDVVYSFRQAKNSPEYQEELGNFVTAEAASLETVVFSLGAYREGAADSLTFPVTQNATADGKKPLPIGTGRYAFMNYGATALTLNPYYPGDKSNIKMINLVPVSDEASLMQTLDGGAIDAFFDDLSSGIVTQTSGQSVFTALPNLVYVGFNSESYAFSDPVARQAVYYAVNRRAAAQSSYDGLAREAYTPFHPDWYRLKESGYDQSALALDFAKAAELLGGSDLAEGARCTLLVHSGNAIKLDIANRLAEDLAQLGITADLYSADWDEYRDALAKGYYDLYIGEVVVPACMDIGALVSGGGSVYGISDTDTTAAAFSQYMQGNIDISAFMDSFVTNSPFVPVVYRDGALYCSGAISPAADTDYLDPFKNIAEWRFE